MNPERAVVFGRDGNLLGVITEPAAVTGADRPAVVFLNAGIIHRVGPSRYAVEAAREFAAAGYRALRFDISGIGDSAPAGDGSLSEVVRRDIRAAVDLVAGDAGVVLVGLCSGADSAFFVGAEDPRVRGLVLIDPAVPRTSGFRRRRALRRISEPAFWWRVISGRSLALRIRQSHQRSAPRPPGYYGLLTCQPDEARRRAADMTGRGVQFLYVLTSGVTEFCNSPVQVQEAIPCFNGNLRTEWREQADHLLSRAADRRWLARTIVEWLEQRVTAVPHARSPAGA